MLFLVKYLRILVFKVLSNRLTMASLTSRLWVVSKLIPWRLKYRWMIPLTNSVPLTDCIINRLFGKPLKLLWFRCHSFPLESRFKHVKIFLLHLRRIFSYRISRGSLNLQDPFPRYHQYLLPYMGTLSLQIYANCTCQFTDTHTCTYFY